MFTMFSAVCPVCHGSVTNIAKRPGMYWCNHCHAEHEDKALKLLPKTRGNNANSNGQADPKSVPQGNS